MTTHSTILALAAAAALAASALVPTSASAARTFSTFSHGGPGMAASVARSAPRIPGPLGVSVNPGLSHFKLGVSRLPSGVGPHPQLGLFRKDRDHDHDKFAFDKKPIDIDCVSFKPHCDHDHDHDHDRDHDWWWWRHHHRDHDDYAWWGSPYVIGGDDTAVSAPASVAAPASPAAAPCTCLTRRYLDDGSVLFTDVCTKEQAMATPDQLHGQAQNP